ATPETVKKLIALGASVSIESGAGQAAAFPDSAYESAGATLGARADVLKNADIVLRVQLSGPADLEGVKKGALLAGMFSPYQNAALIKECADKNINAFSMELVPRITRAQAMDVLSSQS